MSPHVSVRGVHREPMAPAVPDEQRREVVDALRSSGARFALLHSSRSRGEHRPDSDVDVAAWWGVLESARRGR